MLDSKSLGEVFCSIAFGMMNMSSIQQVFHCYVTRSAAGIPWNSLKTRVIAITFFVLGTASYGGPITMFIGNLLGIATTLMIVTIKWREERRLKNSQDDINLSLCSDTLGNKVS